MYYGWFDVLNDMYYIYLATAPLRDLYVYATNGVHTPECAEVTAMFDFVWYILWEKAKSSD